MGQLYSRRVDVAGDKDPYEYVYYYYYDYIYPEDVSSVADFDDFENLPVPMAAVNVTTSETPTILETSATPVPTPTSVPASSTTEKSQDSS